MGPFGLRILLLRVETRGGDGADGQLVRQNEVAYIARMASFGSRRSGLHVLTNLVKKYISHNTASIQPMDVIGLSRGPWMAHKQLYR
jgi:hypothetical protein